MNLSLSVAKGLHASQVAIFALKLHRVKLLVNLLTNIDKARLFALEGALTCLLSELVQAHLVEPVFAFFALPGVLKDG